MSHVIFEGKSDKVNGFTETIESATLPGVESLIRDYFKLYPQHIYDTLVLRIERFDTKVVAILQRKETPTTYHAQGDPDYNYRNMREKNLFRKH
jgi:hypothetical protein